MRDDVSKIYYNIHFACCEMDLFNLLYFGYKTYFGHYIYKYLSA